MIEKAGNGRKDYRGTQVELVKRTVRTVHKQGLLELVRHTRGECDTTPPKSTISAAPDVDTPLHVNFALVQGPGPPRLAEEPPPWQTHDRDHTAARREHGGLSCVKHQLCTTNTGCLQPPTQTALQGLQSLLGLEHFACFAPHRRLSNQQVHSISRWRLRRGHVHAHRLRLSQ